MAINFYKAKSNCLLSDYVQAICQGIYPGTVLARTATEYGTGTDFLKLVEEDLIAERIAIMIYRELIEWFGSSDPTTRRMLEQILEDERACG